jgi:hypothetical protein
MHAEEIDSEETWPQKTDGSLATGEVSRPRLVMAQALRTSMWVVSPFSQPPTSKEFLIVDPCLGAPIHTRLLETQSHSLLEITLYLLPRQTLLSPIRTIPRGFLRSLKRPRTPLNFHDLSGNRDGRFLFSTVASGSLARSAQVQMETAFFFLLLVLFGGCAPFILHTRMLANLLIARHEST